MRPMGKPKPGFEKSYREIFNMFDSGIFPDQSFLDKLLGRKKPTKDELKDEWFANQISSYETIKAPRVGRDEEAEQWVKNQFKEVENKPSFEEFRQQYEGYYVIPLAKEKDGLPDYVAFGQDQNVFRGQFLNDCIDLIGEELVAEAWTSKYAEETLDYGNRLMEVANEIGQKHGLEHLQNVTIPRDGFETEMESKLHIVYNLAKWLVFYGQNGHGYEADY